MAGSTSAAPSSHRVRRTGRLGAALAGSTAIGLPSDVAAAIGRPAGSTRLGAWSTGDPGAFPDPNAYTDANPDPDSTPTPTPKPSTPNSTPSQLPHDAAEPDHSHDQPDQRRHIAQDDFERSTTGGWGKAEVGALDDPCRVRPVRRWPCGSGTVKLHAGDGFAARLDQVASTGSNVRIATSVDQPPGGPGYFLNVIGRQVGGYGDYRAKFGIAANGTVSVWLVKTVGGTETVLSSASTGLKYTVGETLVLRTQVSGKGSTTVQAKVWKINTAEPAAWSVSGDGQHQWTAGPGSLGLYAYSGGTSNGAPVFVHVDGLLVRSTG